MLRARNVLLAVTGSIAAYKAAELIRLFIKAGAQVKVCMTPEAMEFITPLTLATLSKNPVYTAFTEGEKPNRVWNNHIDLGLWADYMVFAPLTANTLAKMAQGQSDNFLIATYLSARCPVFVAPAMDLDMYAHPTTQSNLETLTRNGDRVIPSTWGELASGLVGAGRMAAPQQIIDCIQSAMRERQPLCGKSVLLTAGPTYEPIDPVRFIGNRSSGKMGFALAQSALALGAAVTMVLGPIAPQFTEKDLTLLPVRTAAEMLEAVQAHFAESDIFIAAAAVSDYRPRVVSPQKMKKQQVLLLELVKNPDILKAMGAQKKSQITVGFALETADEEENAVKKLIEKKADCMVINSLRDPGAGFSHDTNKIKIVTQDGEKVEFDLKPKLAVAADIFKFIIQKYYAPREDLA
ncbi:MAG: bifunctional phosphopantothenoylcysteine decarboxylase/phosphopantothenate--cysteine ligase CoaBC [Flavobacteriales bacterium]